MYIDRRDVWHEITSTLAHHGAIVVVDFEVQSLELVEVMHAHGDGAKEAQEIASVDSECLHLDFGRELGAYVECGYVNPLHEPSPVAKSMGEACSSQLLVVEGVTADGFGCHSGCLEGASELRGLAEVIAIERPSLGDGADVSDLALGEDVIGDEASPVKELRRESKHEHTQLGGGYFDRLCES